MESDYDRSKTIFHKTAENYHPPDLILLHLQAYQYSCPPPTRVNVSGSDIDDIQVTQSGLQRHVSAY